MIEITYSGPADAPRPQREGDAAVDLRAAHGATIPRGSVAMVGTGLRVAIPDGCVGLVVARSGLAAKRGIELANQVGVIDPNYRGEVKVALRNRGGEPFEVEPGMRIAQMLVLPCPAVRYLRGELDDTARGSDGFGSSGVE